MIIRDRAQFLLAAVCVLPIIYEWKHYAGVTSAVWIGFFLYLVLRGLYGAFRNE